MLRYLVQFTLISALFGLSGCSGFRPLYGTNSGGVSVVASMSSLAVEEQRSRAGQIVRNELLDGVTPGQSRFQLKLLVTERIFDIVNLSSTLGARRRYALTAHYELIGTSSGKSLNAGDSFSNVEFDIINVPVADLQAADDARTRASKELGQDLRLRIAAFLSTTKG